MGRRRGPRGHVAHSWAAFTEEDVDDARRAAPDVSLADHAARHGLRHADRHLAPEVQALTPRFAEHVFNASVGELAPGRFGVLAHELLSTGYTTSDSGGHIVGYDGRFHGVRYRDPSSWLTYLWFVGWIFELFTDDSSWPFPRKTLVLPTTTATMLVPEAAMLPSFRVGSADRLHTRHPRLGGGALGGFRVIADGLDEEQRAALFAGPVGRALSALDAPFVEIVHQHGQLLVRRNGFVPPGAALEAFVAGATAFAAALAVAATPEPDPAPFADPLPPAAPTRPAPEPRGVKIGRMRISRGHSSSADLEGVDRDGWGMAFVRAAEEFGLVGEDPGALTRRFPRNPVPGRVRGVLRGTLPGGIDGRLTVNLHRPHERSGRTAVLFAAPGGTADTGPAGVAHEATRLRVAVVDGVVACWNTDLRHGEIALADTAQRAAVAARDLGLLRAQPPNGTERGSSPSGRPPGPSR